MENIRNNFPGGWWAEVAEGPNVGAVLPLTPGRHSLGRHHDNDFVLTDAAVADHHLVIEIKGRTARLTALAAGASLGGGAVEEDGTRRLRDQAHMAVGSTQVRIHGPGRAKDWFHFPRLHLSWAVPVMAFAAVLLVVPLHLGASTLKLSSIALGAKTTDTGASLAHSKVGLRNGPSTGVPASESLRSTPGASVNPADALEMVRARLIAAQLDSVIELAVNDKTLLATGAITPANREKWLATQVWFDETFHGRVALLDKVGAARVENAPQLDIRAVSVGAVPFVITGSGDRYAEGAALPGGWTILHIASDKVKLHNGVRSLDISF